MRRDDKYIQRGKPPCTAIRKTLELSYIQARARREHIRATKTREQSEHGHEIYIRQEWHTPCTL